MGLRSGIIKPDVTNKYTVDGHIIVVSGLPRSGTSLMMKILDACNIPLLTDGLRTPDEDNPKGYYEFNRVKDLESDNSWLNLAHGTAIKVVSPLLQHLNMDKGIKYKIIFMLRNVDEILASQKKMVGRLGNTEDDIEDRMLKQSYTEHLEQVKKWLERQNIIEVRYINYADVVSNPIPIIESVAAFLDLNIDARNIAEVVDSSLYRQRAGRDEKMDTVAASGEKEDQKMVMERLRSLGYL